MAADHATVTALRSHTDGRQREPVFVLDAVDAFLSTPRCNESPNTRRAYDNVLRRVAELIGAYRALVDVDDDEIGAASPCSEATRNRQPGTVTGPPWVPGWPGAKRRPAGPAPSVPGTCERRRETDDQTQAVDRAVIDRICTRRDISLRERLLWRML